MARVYTTYEAKARFSEIIRRIRAGETVVVSYRGTEVAEIRPLEGSGSVLERRLSQLEREGALSPASAASRTRLAPVAKRPGALRRFLESRD